MIVRTCHGCSKGAQKLSLGDGHAGPLRFNILNKDLATSLPIFRPCTLSSPCNSPFVKEYFQGHWRRFLLPCQITFLQENSPESQCVEVLVCRLARNPCFRYNPPSPLRYAHQHKREVRGYSWAREIRGQNGERSSGAALERAGAEGQRGAHQRKRPSTG